MSLLYVDNYLRAIKDPNVKTLLISIAKERTLLPSVMVLSAIAIFTALGIFLACIQQMVAVFGAILLIALAKIWSWYLSHDCAHNAVFRSKKTNSIVGECLSFLNGLSFFSFEAYRKDHVRHHAEKIDIGGFDSGSFAVAHPKLFGVITYAEKIYLPAFYYLIKLINIYHVTFRGSSRERARGVGSLCIYAFAFATFARSSLMIVLVWQASSFLRIHVVRFVDCFQHSFQQVYPEGERLTHGKLYEIQNTFSVPVARKFTFLNLIILNFGYHTAHHCFPTCSWYMLPKLERAITEQLKLYGVSDAREENTTFFDFLIAYHRGRLSRIISTDEGQPYDTEGKFSTHHFTGAYTDKLLG
jgi:fatty acid desaturase